MKVIKNMGELILKPSKYKFKWWSILAIFLIAITFTSCDNDEDEDFGQDRKKLKAGNKKDSSVTDMVDSLQNQFHGIKENEGSDDSMGSDDADLFSVPMNSEAFMAKIAEQ